MLRSIICNYLGTEDLHCLGFHCLDGPVYFTTDYLWPDEFSVWEQSIEKDELSCLRENSLNNACLKHCSFRLWTASWCNFICFIDICKARGVLSTLFWYSYEYSCLHVDIVSTTDSGMHKVKLNKDILLVKEKSTKSVQNAPEILQGNGEERSVPCASSYMLWIASTQRAVKLSIVCTAQKVKFLFVNWMQND